MGIVPTNLICVRHYESVVRVCTRRLRRVNHWIWPRSDQEYEFVARHYKYDMWIGDEGESGTCHKRKVIRIEHHPNPIIRHRRMAHELAHVILYQTDPPWYIHDWPRTGDDAHYAAVLMESMVDKYMAERSQTRLDL